MQGNEPEDYRMHGQDDEDDEEEYEFPYVLFIFVFTLADIILEIAFDMPLIILSHTYNKYHMVFISNQITFIIC